MISPKNDQQAHVDLGTWHEYIADDVPPGAIPSGKPLEMMHIMTWDAYRELPKDDCLTAVQTKPDTIQTRTFWKIKDGMHE